MITFKYQENVSYKNLIEIAQERLKKGYSAVIANRGEEIGNQGEQIAYLVTSGQDPERLVGKRAIALGIVNHLETITF